MSKDNPSEKIPGMDKAVERLKQHNVDPSFPVVLFFNSEKDRDEFMSIVREVKPGLVTEKL